MMPGRGRSGRSAADRPVGGPGATDGADRGGGVTMIRTLRTCRHPTCRHPTCRHPTCRHPTCRHPGDTEQLVDEPGLGDRRRIARIVDWRRAALRGPATADDRGRGPAATLADMVARLADVAA